MAPRRIKIRTLMLVIAMTAVVLFVGETAWRWHRFRALYEYHQAQFEWFVLSDPPDGYRFMAADGVRRTRPEWFPYVTALKAYHQGLAAKYQALYRRPWRSAPLPPLPDTPTPQESLRRLLERNRRL